MLPSTKLLSATWLMKAISATTLLVAVICTSPSASAWEWRYGVGGTNEGGRRGVMPVPADACGRPNGYISVGWSTVAGNDDIYVVRTNCNGQRVFETTIDITGAGDNDRARSIAPTFNSAGLVNGYVITGWTMYSAAGGNNTMDVFIARISCNGRVIWARTYGHPQRNEGGHDIIVTTTGNNTITPPTAAGDIVVAGWAMEPAGGNPARLTDGYLLRTNTDGELITDGAYDNGPIGGPPTDDIFMALTELTPIGANPTGDIMAVGISMDPMVGPKAWAMRVTGVLGAPQGGTFGNVGAGFFGVIELQNPAEVGPLGRPNVVAVGDNGGATDWLAVKMPDGDPRCVAGTIEKAIGIANHAEVAYDVREINYVPNNPALAQWDLVVTGWHDDPNVADPREAHITTMTPALVPIFGNVYNAGAVGAGVEEGWSINVDNVACPQHFIMCGITTAYDPSDLYLVRADMFGFSGAGCQIPYNPIDVVQANCVIVQPRRLQLRLEQKRCPTDVVRNMGQLVCPVPVAVPPAAVDLGISDDAVTHPDDMPFSVATRSENPVSMTVTNGLGKVVATYDGVETDDGTISVPTVGLLPGTYNATFDDGSDRQTLPFVVD